MWLITCLGGLDRFEFATGWADRIIFLLALRKYAVLVSNYNWSYEDLINIVQTKLVWLDFGIEYWLGYCLDKCLLWREAACMACLVICVTADLMVRWLSFFEDESIFLLFALSLQLTQQKLKFVLQIKHGCVWPESHCLCQTWQYEPCIMLLVTRILSNVELVHDWTMSWDRCCWWQVGRLTWH